MLNRIAQVEVIVFKVVNDEILFLLLKRNATRGGFWQSVTGGVNPGEQLIEAVKRELWEETGISEFLRIVDNVYYFEFDTSEYGHLKEYVYGVEVSSNTEIKMSAEHAEMKWCNIAQALELLKYDTNKTAFKNLYDLIKP